MAIVVSHNRKLALFLIDSTPMEDLGLDNLSDGRSSGIYITSVSSSVGGFSETSSHVWRLKSWRASSSCSIVIKMNQRNNEQLSHNMIICRISYFPYPRLLTDHSIAIYFGICLICTIYWVKQRFPLFCQLLIASVFFSYWIFESTFSNFVMLNTAACFVGRLARNPPY